MLDASKVELHNADYLRHKFPALKQMMSRPIAAGFQYIIDTIPDDTSVLDVGCGDGLLLSLLQKQGLTSLQGIDISNEAIDRAKEQTEGINFEVCDLDKRFPFEDDSFDTVVSTQVLEHVNEPQNMVIEMFRVLKPGGVMILTTPIERNLIDPMHKHFFDYYDMMGLFDTLNNDYKIHKINKLNKREKPNCWMVVLVKGRKIEANDLDVAEEIRWKRKTQ